MSDQSILVTGAAGFIGFHVVRALLAAGRTVVGLDNLNSYYDPALKRARLEILRGEQRFAFEQIDLTDRASIERLIDRVMSGGVTVNDALVHVGQHDLPFGGIGDSGMGHYHGHEGFVTFSKLRPVFYQARFSTLKFLTPPYGQFAERVLAFLTR